MDRRDELAEYTMHGLQDHATGLAVTIADHLADTGEVQADALQKYRETLAAIESRRRVLDALIATAR